MEKVTERRSTNEVPDMVGEERELLGEIQRRQRTWMEGVLRREGMLK